MQLERFLAKVSDFLLFKDLRSIDGKSLFVGIDAIDQIYRDSPPVLGTFTPVISTCLFISAAPVVRLLGAGEDGAEGLHPEVHFSELVVVLAEFTLFFLFLTISEHMA